MSSPAGGTGRGPGGAGEPARARPVLAPLLGLVVHGTFLAAVARMAFSLWNGMDVGLGRLTGGSAWLVNGLLALQFPLLHSWLLSARGRRWLGSGVVARTLAPSTYALVASLQLLLTFLCWSPSGVVWWRAEGAALLVVVPFTAAAWLFLGASLAAAGLGLQTGWIGWTALRDGRAPCYPGLPVRGPFRLWRQPIYLGFAWTLWGGPVWGPDRLLLGVLWTTYCALGPLHKERRFARLHGERWQDQLRRVPYLPGWARRAPQASRASGSMP